MVGHFEQVVRELPEGGPPPNSVLLTGGEGEYERSAVKTNGLLGLLSFLLLFAGNQEIAGGPSAAAPGANSSVATERGSNLPARLSEYVFLHQARHEGILAHAMTGVTTCPE